MGPAMSYFCLVVLFLALAVSGSFRRVRRTRGYEQTDVTPTFGYGRVESTSILPVNNKISPVPSNDQEIIRIHATKIISHNQDDPHREYKKLEKTSVTYPLNSSRTKNSFSRLILQKTSGYHQLKPRDVDNLTDTKIHNENNAHTMELNQPWAKENISILNTKPTLPFQTKSDENRNRKLYNDDTVPLRRHARQSVVPNSNISNPNCTEGIGCCRVVDQDANCTGCALTCVPDYLGPAIHRLDLSRNALHSWALEGGVFARYAQLVELYLDENNITYLPETTFIGLENLTILSLYNNSITYNLSLKYSDVFAPLSASLKVLYLNRNTNDTKNESSSFVYPSYALSLLRSLVVLHMDGLRSKNLGTGFSVMTKLTNLSLAGYTAGYCNIHSIDEVMFASLPSLIYLNISDCNLTGSLVDPQAFAHLRNLRVLDVSNNFELGVETVGNITCGLRHNPNFVHLKMVRVVERFSPCVVIYKHTLRCFNETKLEIIEAMNDEIEMVEVGALQLLPPTLKTMNLTNNRIMFGAYWKDMASLTGLTTLSLDGYLNPVRFPTFFPSDQFQCPPTQSLADSDSSIFENNYGNSCPCDTCSSGKSTDFILPLPPKMVNFTMHSNSLAYNVYSLQFCSNNELTSVDLSGNMFPHLQGPIIGLNKLKYLNLSSCFIQVINNTFFDQLVSLEYLNLFQNLLGDCIHNDVTGDIFSSLEKLKYLNLSFSNMYQIRPNAFKNLKNLEVIDLSTNRISHIAFNIRHMRKLRFMDFHKNDIRTLPTELRDLVESLLEANRSVIIDMRENPISCECTNLAFLEWIVVRSEVFRNNFTGYYCKYLVEDQASVERNEGYAEEVARLRKECATHTGLFLGVVAATLMVVVFIVMLLLYRFRWTLRYWFHAAKLSLVHSPQLAGHDFQYDVFISYASEDVDFVLQELKPHLQVERNLSLLIHGENFQTGRHIADNIYMAVSQCRKTLALVTREMLQSQWCTYELQMARMESISRGRNVLVFLFLEDEEIPTSLLNADVLSYIRTSTYVTYPIDAQHRLVFWNKLADDLRAP